MHGQKTTNENNYWGLTLWDVSRSRLVATYRRFGTDYLNLENEAYVLPQNVGGPTVTTHKTEGLSAQRRNPGVA